MQDVLPRIQPVNGMFQRSVPLRDIFIGFLILLLQADCGIDTLIGKGMGERHFRLPVIGVAEPERIHILRIPEIAFRSLDLLHLVPKPNREVCGKYGVSIAVRRHLIKQRAFGYDSIPICIGDIFRSVQSEYPSCKAVARILIFLYHTDIRFLPVI